jgi:acetolactate decarboxylase
MRGRMRRALLLGCIVLIAALGGHASWGRGEGATVFQVSTFDALRKGLYDGQITFGELKKHGDFGMGTLNGLDGEMVGLDGEFYQARGDGKVVTVPDSAQIPFAIITYFREDRKLSLPPFSSLEELQKALDELVPGTEKMYAFRIDGLFEKIKVRSVPRQQKPFPGLVIALKHQTVFDLQNVRGSLVGFRCPQYMDGVNVAGYHFHFITTDRQAGGHVLDCDAESLTGGVMGVDSLSLQFPKD